MSASSVRFFLVEPPPPPPPEPPPEPPGDDPPEEPPEPTEPFPLEALLLNFTPPPEDLLADVTLNPAPLTFLVTSTGSVLYSTCGAAVVTKPEFPSPSDTVFDSVRQVIVGLVLYPTVSVTSLSASSTSASIPIEER